MHDLDSVVLYYTRKGWRVTSRSDTQAQLAKGKPVSHVLHLLLSLITLGFWIPVWILVTIAGGEKHKLVDASQSPPSKMLTKEPMSLLGPFAKPPVHKGELVGSKKHSVKS